MPEIIVLGGGVCGLAAAMLLARDGHDVTVLERDRAPLPATLEEACDAWDRSGVAQFRQAHFMLARGREVLDEELPEVCDALLALGACRFDTLGLMPPAITDRAPRPGDERFVTVTARRPVIELAFARVAQDEPGLEIRRGVGVDALVAETFDGVPHVTGVRTDAGEQMSADLVVDATGRRSQLPRLLEGVGAAPVDENAEDSGFIYYTRFFRARNGGRPQPRAPLVSPLGSFSILTLPADNDTWSVTLYIAAGDRPLKALRHPDRFAAVLAACPLHAHWLDGEPITGVLAMGGVVDRYRRLVVHGRPIVTGVAAVADACACTNPSLGRGMALGLLHGRALRDYVRVHLESPTDLAEVWDTVTEAELMPWYRDTVAEDRARLRDLEAARGGGAPSPADPEAALRAGLFGAAGRDPDLFRAMLQTRGCLATTREVLDRPGVAERILALAPDGPRPLPGPNREELLALLG
jgi:2-polyprenyl-6-methoxyphenol hydroxylase-like FAD-dependent oxidoreductase